MFQSPPPAYGTGVRHAALPSLATWRRVLTLPTLSVSHHVWHLLAMRIFHFCTHRLAPDPPPAGLSSSSPPRQHVCQPVPQIISLVLRRCGSPCGAVFPRFGLCPCLARSGTFHFRMRHAGLQPPLFSFSRIQFLPAQEVDGLLLIAH